jgi:hypothetical protein
VSGLQTEFEFVLPKGFVDDEGRLHRRGRMRLATGRDELEPLRDPSIDGPDDPLLTVLVLARVVTAIGTVAPVTTDHINGLFAVDLAFLQDFYGVVNFGSDEDVEALVASQRDAMPVPTPEPEPMTDSDLVVEPSLDIEDEEPVRRRLEEVSGGVR